MLVIQFNLISFHFFCMKIIEKKKKTTNLHSQSQAIVQTVAFTNNRNVATHCY